jgi:DNA-directed RNA polymerase specialized sigma24 family protein
LKATIKPARQERYLRWLDAQVVEIQFPKAYLMTVVSWLSLDALKSARRKREVYPGPWLPEPLSDAQTEFTLETGDRLLVYTDGLVEAVNARAIRSERPFGRFHFNAPGCSSRTVCGAVA